MPHPARTRQADPAAAVDEVEDHDLGLSADLPRLVARNLGRRGLLGLLGGVGLVAAGCATDSGATSSAATAGDARPAGGPGGAPPDGQGAESDVVVADGEIPEETAGPYPGDGSDGVNVLTESGIVRSDLTSSFGSASGVAEGVPVTVRLKVLDLQGDDASPLVGAALYLWHCNRDGEYSMYSEAVADENYLRGVQETDTDGRVEFTSIFPAAYDGRWPHMHVEVYASVASATSYTRKLRTSQLALPQEACDAVYATEGYEASVANLAATSLDSDTVFSDGHTLQMASATGSVDEGYVLSLTVPV